MTRGTNRQGTIPSSVVPFCFCSTFRTGTLQALHQCVMLMFFHVHVVISCIHVLAGGEEVCDTNHWNSPPCWPVPHKWMTTHLPGGGLFPQAKLAVGKLPSFITNIRGSPSKQLLYQLYIVYYSVIVGLRTTYIWTRYVVCGYIPLNDLRSFPLSVPTSSTL